jgi:two-component sensor histidine kinase
LDVSGTSDEQDLILTWSETGGPTVRAAPEIQGFGSKMMSRSISQQLDGALSYDWKPTGVVVTLRMRKDRLAD